MATTPPTITQLDPRDGSVMKYTWVLTGTNDGAPMPFVQWADRSVQIGSTGDTWGGGTVVWEGSNDGGATWFTLTGSLTAASATAISKTSNAMTQVVETTELARPRASVSVTQITVTCVARRQQQMRR